MVLYFGVNRVEQYQYITRLQHRSMASARNSDGGVLLIRRTYKLIRDYYCTRTPEEWLLARVTQTRLFGGVNGPGIRSYQHEPCTCSSGHPRSARLRCSPIAASTQSSSRDCPDRDSSGKTTPNRKSDLCSYHFDRPNRAEQTASDYILVRREEIFKRK